MNADFSETGQTRDSETYAIIGVAMEVHRELRHGLVEPVYQDGLEVEFSARGIPFEREKLLKVLYKGRPLPSFFKADFVCYESVIVECKSQVSIGSVEDAQVINYLRISGLERAVLLNFGTPSLQYKRFVLSQK
ncbi:MAG: GxxExxY protein [Verrucomicrobiota bacterium]